ncbi:hypothetical protein ACLOJK_040156 [Asimina triloba]
MEAKGKSDQNPDNLGGGDAEGDPSISSCLDLTSFQLPDLEGIGLPLELIELDLTANRLSTLDSRIGLLSQLKKLSLRQNLFEDAGVEVLSHWTTIAGLQELILRDNRLTKIPDVSIFKSLLVFDVSFNEISFMNGICNVSSTLKELYVSKNEVTKMEELDHLHDLQILELGSNRLRVMENLQNLTHLQELWLGRNRIKVVNLCGLKCIRKLSLQSNRLTSMLGFQDCVALEELYLSHNGIPKMEGLSTLANLRVLDISSNKITCISDIQNLTRLEDLWLNDNQIASMEGLDEAVAGSKEKLTTIYLEHNPCAKSPNYCATLRKIFPNLQQIDSNQILRDNIPFARVAYTRPRGIFTFQKDVARCFFQADMRKVILGGPKQKNPLLRSPLHWEHEVHVTQPPAEYGPPVSANLYRGSRFPFKHLGLGRSCRKRDDGRRLMQWPPRKKGFARNTEPLCYRAVDNMTNGRKPPPEVGIQMPDSKVAADSATMSGPLVPVSSSADSKPRRKYDLAHALLRILCLLSSTAALSFMVSAEQSATVSVYGLELPVYSKWSFSDSFENARFPHLVVHEPPELWEDRRFFTWKKRMVGLIKLHSGSLRGRFLVGISAAVAAHSLMQLVLSVSKILKSPVIPSRNHAWILFGGDQVFAYAVMSAGSASASVTNLNRTGIHHTALPNFCKPLNRFYGQQSGAIAAWSGSEIWWGGSNVIWNSEGNDFAYIPHHTSLSGPSSYNSSPSWPRALNCLTSFQLVIVRS